MNPRRHVTIGISSLAALATSFALGVAVSDSPVKDRNELTIAAGSTPMSTSTKSPAMNGELNSASSCDELLEWYVAQGIKRVGPYGWDTNYGVMMDAGTNELSKVAPQAGSASRVQSDSPMNAATASATGTNVQEAGVDEPDVVKTNGSMVVRIQDHRLTTYDVTGAQPKQLATLRLDNITEAELLLVDNSAVILGIDDQSTNLTQRTRMIQVDLANPASPTVTNTQVFSPTLVSATQHGTTVRLALSQGLPDLNFTQPRRWRNQEAALKRNQEVVRASTIEDWLPSVGTDGIADAEPLAECNRVAIPEDESGLGTLAVVGFDPAAPATMDVVAVATDSQTAYTSTDRLYLATDDNWGGGWWRDQCCIDDWGSTIRSDIPDGITQLHAFTLDDITATYLASGEVEGSIADRWAMDEADGVLRLAVGPTNATGNFNSVVTLAVEGDQLVEMGRLNKLGINEDIQSMRWFDDLAVMVTFRQVDPLYAIDLSNSEQPRLLGNLKIPGFSDYLHPLGPHRLIGMGVDATRNGRSRGAQAGLFNLYHLDKPWRESKVSYGPRTQALAGQDPRQFTWLREQRIALTVIAKGEGSRTGFVSVLKVVDGEFVQRLVEVEYGDEVADVRLVPLTNGPAAGKIVLVTGDTLTFFSLE